MDVYMLNKRRKEFLDGDKGGGMKEQDWPEQGRKGTVGKLLRQPAHPDPALTCLCESCPSCVSKLTPTFQFKLDLHLCHKICPFRKDQLLSPSHCELGFCTPIWGTFRIFCHVSWSSFLWVGKSMAFDIEFESEFLLHLLVTVMVSGTFTKLPEPVSLPADWAQKCNVLERMETM